MKDKKILCTSCANLYKTNFIYWCYKSKSVIKPDDVTECKYYENGGNNE